MIYTQAASKIVLSKQLELRYCFIMKAFSRIAICADLVIVEISLYVYWEN